MSESVPSHQPVSAERNVPGAGFEDLLSLQVTVKGKEGSQIPPVSSLEDLYLEPTLFDNVSQIIKSLTPIQRYAMPTIMNGKNVMCCSYTGSGKTAAFLVPIINNMLTCDDAYDDICPGLPACPLFLVLVPTRELAIQIKAEADSYCENTILQPSVHLVCGGKVMHTERKRLARQPCNIVVATNGRLLDLISQNIMDLHRVKYFVLDEADVMMAKGFFFEVVDIGNMCQANFIGAMFSATYPNAVRKASENLLGNSFIEILVGDDGATASKSITQEFEVVERCEKDFMLRTYLDSRPTTDKILVFGSTIPDVERIAKFILDNGRTASWLHSELLSQNEREVALKQFKKNEVQVLVATSIAARGLDIPNVSLVINYDLPGNLEEYILRIGRTGRVGNEGSSISFFEIERDGPLADQLISSLRRADQVIPGWMHDIKKKVTEDENRFKDAYDLGEFSNASRTYNAIGSSIMGIPCPCEVEDDDWD